MVSPLSGGSQRGSEQGNDTADQTTPDPSYSGGEIITYSARRGRMTKVKLCSSGFTRYS